MSDATTSNHPFEMFEGEDASLQLKEDAMLARQHIFLERADEGWEGNGYDWASIATVVIREQMPETLSAIELDPEAGRFAAYGPLEALTRLGESLAVVYADEAALRDLLGRAELD